MFNGLPQHSYTGGAPHSRGFSAFNAGIALARLDERLTSAPEPVRAGWITRAAVFEAIASQRLNGSYVNVEDLTLMLADAVLRTPDQDVGRAVHAYEMLRALTRRSPQHLFRPQRLIALIRLRLRDRSGHADERMPYWLRERLRDRTPEAIRDALEEALRPEVVAAYRPMPPLEGAGAFLARWHASGAAACIGAEYGRALASAWVCRAELTSGYYLLPSVGFLGHAADYRPDLDSKWGAHFLGACERAGDWGLRLHGKLTASYRCMHEAAAPRSAKSRMVALVDLIVARPVISADGAAQSLNITSHAARRLLGTLETKGLIQEFTGRGSFRLYGLPQ
jgi:hypothetical protein